MIIIKERQTLQKKYIMEVVQALDCHPTAEEIYAEVAARCPAISRATVYRQLGRLAEKGEILRVQVAGTSDRFDHTVGRHCHGRCRGCGKVFDVDSALSVSFSEPSTEEFEADGYEIWFSGYCRRCREADMKEQAI